MGALHVNGQKATGLDITLADGVFIDADNMITSGTLTNSEATSYTATEDCYFVAYSATGNALSYLIDNVSVIFAPANQTHSLLLKKGQTLTVGEASAYNVSYRVYGIQQGTIEGKLQPVIYSLEEREIGVWTDGKPLYQRTFVFTTANDDNYNYYVTDIANPETMIVDFSASFYILSSTVCNPIAPYGRATTGDNEMQVLLNDVNDVLRIDYRVGTQARNKTAVISIKYTKTTDQPGSGTWIPDEVYAHHYSTDEKVVGTWINGKTIYEITTDMGTAGVSINSGASKDSNIPIGNIENITYSQAISQSGKYFPVFGAELGDSYVQMINMGSSNRNVRWFTIQYTKSS